MNAMIFAAGLGTRLAPLTNSKPKALVEFDGQPLLYHAIQKVIEAGAKCVVVNTHHFADQIEEYINSNRWSVPVLISHEKDLLLDTGGGVKNAKSLFLKDEPILLYNADIITNQSLSVLVEAHCQSGNDATLMVKKRKGSRYLRFNKLLQLCGWRNVETGEEITPVPVADLEDYGFCGIQVITYDFIDAMGTDSVFSIVKSYLACAKDYKIGAWVLPEDRNWFDVGSVEKLAEAEKIFRTK